MKVPNRVLTLPTAEHRMMIRGLLQFRNNLIGQRYHVDDVNALFLKLT